MYHSSIIIWLNSAAASLLCLPFCWHNDWTILFIFSCLRCRRVLIRQGAICVLRLLLLMSKKNNYFACSAM